MKYKLTVLNIATIFFIIIVLIYTIKNYKVLSANEGWGIVAMIGLIMVGLVAGFIDLLLQKFITNILIVNLIGIIIVIGVAILFITNH